MWENMIENMIEELREYIREEIREEMKDFKWEVQKVESEDELREETFVLHHPFLFLSLLESPLQFLYKLALISG